MSTKQYSVIVFIVVFSILGSFYSGYFLKETVLKNKNENLSTNSQKEYIPFFNDEVVLITKEVPHYTLVANASRFLNESGQYTHRQRIFYFDGNEWTDNFSTTDSNNLEIAKTSLIPEWEVKDNPSLVLKQSIKGNVQTDKGSIYFNIPLITNELGIRSLPHYTVFRSEAIGELTIEGKKYESYVLYSRTYSYNKSVGLVTLSQEPLGLSTDWIAFWDTEGNFYNIDETIVDSKEEDPYKSHSIAVLKDKEGKVEKSFTLDVQKNKEVGYEVSIFENINQSLNLYFLNAVSRNPTNEFVDNKIGQIEGTVKLEGGKIINGFGLYEYIYQ